MLQYDPHEIAITSFYLSTKTEECFVKISDIANHSQKPIETITKQEVPILEASKFKLKCWHPWHPLQGFLLDLKLVYKENKT
eukprot:UN15965